MKLINVCGARPNFMKIAPLMRAYAAEAGIEPILVHTGQHYDRPMSHLFFEELQIPEPDINLEVGSGSHAQQAAIIMQRFEPVVVETEADAVPAARGDRAPESGDDDARTVGDAGGPSGEAPSPTPEHLDMKSVSGPPPARAAERGGPPLSAPASLRRPPPASRSSPVARMSPRPPRSCSRDGSTCGGSPPGPRG